MSLIVHRCSCGHPDFQHFVDKHSQRRCGGPQCTAGVDDHVTGPPEVIPSWDGLGRPVQQVHAPGSTTGPVPACDCGDCRALYAEVRQP